MCPKLASSTVPEEEKNCIESVLGNGQTSFTEEAFLSEAGAKIWKRFRLHPKKVKVKNEKYRYFNLANLKKTIFLKPISFPLQYLKSQDWKNYYYLFWEVRKFERAKFEMPLLQYSKSWSQR